MLFPRLASVVLLAVLLPRAVFAQDASGLAADRAVKGSAEAEKAQETKRPFRDSWFIWDNATTTQTLHVGSSYQSYDPTYDVSLSVRPRYYFYETERARAYVGGRIDLAREFTNSNVTTAEHETTLTDATVLMGYRRTFSKDVSRETYMIASLPILTLPTSKFSWDNGTILGVGGGFRIAQVVPLAGDKWPVFKRLDASVFAGYTHTFTRATVPTNPELHRVRITPEGNTVPGDQLTGAAFPEHEGRIDARLITDITDDLSLWLEGSYRPTWTYGFSAADVCIQTGCIPAQRPADPQRFVVLTGITADVYYQLLPELSIGVGYENVVLQPGPDGQRRSVIWSPGALFHFSLVAYLDPIIQAAAGKRRANGRLTP